MTRVDTMRSQITQLIRAKTFHPFVLNMENGDRVVVEHPENFAIDFSEDGRDAIAILSKKLQLYSNLSAITSVAALDRGEPS